MQWVASHFLNNHVKRHTPVVVEKMTSKEIAETTKIG